METLAKSLSLHQAAKCGFMLGKFQICTVNSGMIQRYISKKLSLDEPVTGLVVEQLKTVGHNNSFKVGVHAHYYDAMNNSEFWPSGVVIRRFNFKKQQQWNREASSDSNFLTIAANQEVVRS